MSGSSTSKSEGIIYDHHGYKVDDPSLKGFSRYFNNSTIRGRANVAKLTIACITGVVLFKKVLSSSRSNGAAEEAGAE
jgi:hypothetical protein